MKKIKADRRVVGTRPWFYVDKMYRDQRREQAKKHDRKEPKVVLPEQGEPHTYRWFLASPLIHEISRKFLGLFGK